MIVDKMNLKQILYPKTIQEARQVQVALLKELKLTTLKQQPSLIAAVDSAFLDNQVLAAVCLFSFPELNLLEQQTIIEPHVFPYISGFLSFCEGPAVYKAIQRLSQKPGLILVDGQGIAHPRKMGLASYLGIILNTPSVGCAKSRLVGSFESPGPQRGSCSEMRHKGDLVGYVLRSRSGVKPIYISPGHLINQDDSLKLVKQCLRGFRIPEPLRQAHILSQKMKSLNRNP